MAPGGVIVSVGSGARHLEGTYSVGVCVEPHGRCSVGVGLGFTKSLTRDIISYWK